MARINEFEDLDVWKKSRELCKMIYDKLEKGSFSRDFGLRDQINRSSGSMMDNIAEGFERDGRQEFVQFLSYSKASAGEVRSQLYRAFDRNHLTKEEFDDMIERTREISKSLKGFMNYLKNSDIKGTKYKASESLEEYTNLKSEI